MPSTLWFDAPPGRRVLAVSDESPDGRQPSDDGRESYPAAGIAPTAWRAARRTVPADHARPLQHPMIAPLRVTIAPDARMVVGCMQLGARGLDGVGEEVDGLAPGAALALLLAPVEVSIDVGSPAFVKVAEGVLALGAEDADVELIVIVSPLPTRRDL